MLDGANIGYNGQNYSEGQFRYEQIEAVRAAVKRSSPVEEDPLIILPSRYAVQDGKSKIPNKARCSKPGGVTVDAKGLALLDSWQESGRLWVVPNESNDDWYWLLAVGSSVRTSGCTGRRARRRRHPRTFLDDCSRVPRNRISGAEVGQPQAARTWPEIGSRGHERHDAGPRTLMYAMPCLHVVLVAPYRPPTHIDSTW